MARASLIFFVFVALFAHCLAGDLPIVMSQAGDLHVFSDLPKDTLLKEEPFSAGERRSGANKGKGGSTLRGEELAEVLTDSDWAIWPLIRIDPNAVRVNGELHVLQEPSSLHWLGTDDRGRDVASRLVHGTQHSLVLAIACGFFATLLGGIFAVVACKTKWGDTLVLYLCDSIAAVPVLLIVLSIRGMMGTPSMAVLIVLVSLSRSASVTRVIRDGLKNAMVQPYYQAAQALGYGESRLLWRHALPQCIPQLQVSAALAGSTAILTEIALSFLGLGLPGEEPSWGELLRQAQENQMQWWLLIPAGLATALLTWSLQALARTRRATKVV